MYATEIVGMFDIKQVDVIFLLEHFRIKYSFASEVELKILCPFHRDTNPSCFINREKKVFSCHTSGCERTGDVISLVAAMLNKSRRYITEYLVLEISCPWNEEDSLKEIRSKRYNWIKLREKPQKELDDIMQRIKDYEEHECLRKEREYIVEYERDIKRKVELIEHINKIIDIINELNHRRIYLFIATTAIPTGR